MPSANSTEKEYGHQTTYNHNIIAQTSHINFRLLHYSIGFVTDNIYPAGRR